MAIARAATTATPLKRCFTVLGIILHSPRPHIGPTDFAGLCATMYLSRRAHAKTSKSFMMVCDRGRVETRDRAVGSSVPLRTTIGAGRVATHNRPMPATPDLDDDERAELIAVLREAIECDR
jgi:hypothetical protein